MFPMLKQKQRWLHLEDGRCGDCYRTCIAGYLGMVRDSVPHFVELHGGEDWNDSEAIARAIELWMKERGLVMISIPVNGEVPFDALANDVARQWLPGVDRLIIGGTSPRGYPHVILWDREDGYWDPAKNYRGEGDMLVGPQDDGNWWIVAILPSWSRVEPAGGWGERGDPGISGEGVFR